MALSRFELRLDDLPVVRADPGDAGEEQELQCQGAPIIGAEDGGERADRLHPGDRAAHTQHRGTGQRERGEERDDPAHSVASALGVTGPRYRGEDAEGAEPDAGADEVERLIEDAEERPDVER